MKLHLEQMAADLLNSGFKSRDAESQKFVDRVVELLDNRDLFSLLADEMDILEDEKIGEA